MAPQPPRGGPRQRYQPTPRGVNMIVWSLDNRFVLAAIMGTFGLLFHMFALQPY
jgi:PH-interacting protein